MSEPLSIVKPSKLPSFLYRFFLLELGDEVYADDSCDLKKRTVDMFHSRIDELNQ